jgi:hypothetical protein
VSPTRSPTWWPRNGGSQVQMQLVLRGPPLHGRPHRAHLTLAPQVRGGLGGGLGEGGSEKGRVLERGWRKGGGSWGRGWRKGGRVGSMHHPLLWLLP